MVTSIISKINLLNLLTAEYVLAHQLLYVGRNIQILLNVCQKIADCVRFVANHIDLIRKILKIADKL